MEVALTTHQTVSHGQPIDPTDVLAHPPKSAAYERVNTTSERARGLSRTRGVQQASQCNSEYEEPSCDDAV